MDRRTLLLGACLLLILRGTPMLTNADRVLDFIIEDEGLLKISPGEPGGASMRGVSMTAFIEWRHLRGKPTPSLLDLEHMQVWEARELYLVKYMKPISFNTLPLGVDYVCADEAVNSGVGAALTLHRGHRPFRGCSLAHLSNHRLTYGGQARLA